MPLCAAALRVSKLESKHPVRGLSDPLCPPLITASFLSISGYHAFRTLQGFSFFSGSPRIGGVQKQHISHPTVVSHFSWRWDDEEFSTIGEDVSFAKGVGLFNRGEYYECHDVLENLWHSAAEPRRSVLHGILQCSVGLYHLLNQNHRGAMAELGEGLSKLRRQRFTAGPFYHFEQETAAVLDYLYNTQLEHAACADDICMRMDGSEQSYQLLGNFGAGQQLYEVQRADNDEVYIYFNPQRISDIESEVYAIVPVKVKLPLLQATEDDLYRLR